MIKYRLRQKTVRESFAHSLRYFRVKREWSQTTLANKVGVSQNMISSLEKGLRWVKPEVLDRLSVIFGIGVDQFFVEKKRKLCAPKRGDR